jgi:hypothetical protein
MTHDIDDTVPCVGDIKERSIDDHQIIDRIYKHVFHALITFL